MCALYFDKEAWNVSAWCNVPYLKGGACLRRVVGVLLIGAMSLTSGNATTHSSLTPTTFNESLRDNKSLTSVPGALAITTSSNSIPEVEMLTLLERKSNISGRTFPTLLLESLGLDDAFNRLLFSKLPEGSKLVLQRIEIVKTKEEPKGDAAISLNDFPDQEEDIAEEESGVKDLALAPTSYAHPIGQYPPSTNDKHHRSESNGHALKYYGRHPKEAKAAQSLLRDPDVKSARKKPQEKGMTHALGNTRSHHRQRNNSKKKSRRKVTGTRGDDVKSMKHNFKNQNQKVDENSNRRRPTHASYQPAYQNQNYEEPTHPNDHFNGQNFHPRLSLGLREDTPTEVPKSPRPSSSNVRQRSRVWSTPNTSLPIESEAWHELLKSTATSIPILGHNVEVFPSQWGRSILTPTNPFYAPNFEPSLGVSNPRLRNGLENWKGVEAVNGSLSGDVSPWPQLPGRHKYTRQSWSGRPLDFQSPPHRKTSVNATSLLAHLNQWLM